MNTSGGKRLFKLVRGGLGAIPEYEQETGNRQSRSDGLMDFLGQLKEIQGF